MTHQIMVEKGTAVRIFTGAALPEGADSVIAQEEGILSDSILIISHSVQRGSYIRPVGMDFSKGDILIKSGVKLNSRTLSLAAAGNIKNVIVRKKPVVAILATGDELQPPGTKLQRGEIVSSIPYGLTSMIEQYGGSSHNLGIARDNEASLLDHFEHATSADILVTIGGASVGDHDLVRPVLARFGMKLNFWKIAMRPGKPLIFGRLGHTRVLGLPGNPVSSFLTARLFLVPMILRMLGISDQKPRIKKARLVGRIAKNGPREHYLRASISTLPDGSKTVSPALSQDSSLLSNLVKANGLVIRKPHAPSAMDGELVSYMAIDF